MEYFSITKRRSEFHIEGFPDAVKVVRLHGPEARRISDLALHETDLKFALECLEAINGVPESQPLLRQALWQSSIVHFAKCFGGNKSRDRLDPKSVYAADAQAMESYRYFKGLRDKHLVHDENSYSQCLPGAVVNKKEMNHKIAKIVCLSVSGETLGQANFSNLHLLISKARQWVAAQYDLLCEVLTAKLELEPYGALLKRAGIVYSPPKLEELQKRRNVK